MVFQTTSHYPLKQTDTTQEEIAAPGKLPETPLRMDPDLLYEDGEEDLGRQADQQTTEKIPIRESMSSYRVRKTPEEEYLLFFHLYKCVL